MKILITGGNGFVGKHLAEYVISQGHTVFATYVVPTNLFDGVEWRLLNVLDLDATSDLICDIKPDVVFHLAAQSSAHISWKQPQETMSVNINGTVNLLEVIRLNVPETLVLLIGSSEEYGIIKENENPINEDQKLRPANPYAVSKLAQNHIGRVYAKAYGMKILMTRSFNHIGPGQDERFVISDFSKRIVDMEKGLVEKVLKVGNLKAKRDFSDVRDIVKAYYLIAQKGEFGKTYNVGSGYSVSIQELLDKIIQLSDVCPRIEVDPNRLRPSDVPTIQCDYTELKSDTGWTPEFTIEESLVDILEYWRSK